MILLGIDPGKTTGWCAYDVEARTVIEGGEFPEHLVAWQGTMTKADAIVIERPRVFPGSPPAMGDCCITAGILWHKLMTLHRRVPLWITRDEVRKRLTKATYGTIHVVNDATTWAALKQVHGGEDSAKKARVKKGKIVAPAGAIGSITSHARAALAAAVASCTPVATTA